MPELEHDQTTWPSWATEPITVVGYNPEWPERAHNERDHLRQLLAPCLVGEIEHIGSTAIPGLAAKPIIDLQAPIRDLADADMVDPILAPHGWHYVPPELDQRPYRRFFVKVAKDHRSAHLHLMTLGAARWHQQLAFRDALRTTPDLVRAYGQLKVELAHRHSGDREAYTAGKQRFVRDALARWPRG